MAAQEADDLHRPATKPYDERNGACGPEPRGTSNSHGWKAAHIAGPRETGIGLQAPSNNRDRVGLRGQHPLGSPARKLPCVPGPSSTSDADRDAKQLSLAWVHWHRYSPTSSTVESYFIPASLTIQVAPGTICMWMRSPLMKRSQNFRLRLSLRGSACKRLIRSICTEAADNSQRLSA